MEYIKPFAAFIAFGWRHIYPQIAYATYLDRKRDELSIEVRNLTVRHHEIQTQLQEAVSVGKTKLRQVDMWIQEVEKVQRDVASIENNFQQSRTCFHRYRPNLFRRFKMGKKLVKTKNAIEKLLWQAGGFSVVAESPRRPLMQELQVPSQLQQQSTSAKALRKIEEALLDDSVCILGVCGMGGIGKTTLMKKICNRFVETEDFDIVIWVTVSKDLNLQVIQQKIGNKLGVRFHENEGMEEKRDRLYARLRNVRYMLVLDDLWLEFSLDEVGIPQPNKQNRCKIVITTRLNEVSNAMETDRQIKIKPLRSEEAWDLFSTKAGDVILLPQIRPLAENVVEECGGLPIAIITVGRAMRQKDEKESWLNAVRALKRSAPEIRGMEREVFLPLKLSYDYLEDSKIQSCFLYCSLYPEDYDIPTNDVVTYWAFEEGLIDNVCSLDEALNKGHYILQRLKDACLLDEADKGHISPHVRMHDLLRDLAIWITSHSSSSFPCFQASKFLVKAGEGLEQPPKEQMWEGIERISLMCNEIKELQITPNCPNLVSLFLCYNRKLHTIRDDFFQFMPKLRILDLRSTCIQSLPQSLSQLVNLRALILAHSSSLVEMPPIGKLKELRLLDLQATGIKKLPDGISNLVKLKKLDLSLTDALTMIPRNLISALTCLEDLRLWGKAQMHVSTCTEVATLTHLCYLTINLSKLEHFNAHDMYSLQSLSNLKEFLVCFGGDGGFNLKQTEKDLHIIGCRNFPKGIKGLIDHVTSLKLSNSEAPEHLSQILGYSKSLKRVEVTSSNGVKCIIDWAEMEDPYALDCLQFLYLHRLDFLDRVFDGVSHLPRTCFQQLQQVDITSCPKLRYVFSSSMVDHFHQLKGLRIKDCKEMQEIVQGDILPDNMFQSLSYLSLICLPRLTSMCSRRLTLTALEQINVEGCPQLKKLPVLCSSIQKIRGEVKGKIEWSEEDDYSKSLYSAIYTEIEPQVEISMHECEEE